ncbi:hypothetical protein AK88_04262 [Plasmodium fragile]|uniref:Schizont-infected cell agglutination C-terminal domain-containing protein n=1 Tax=Plasmodium fragile TaxID=5857 RepID=A0A0D9QK37_PLAFR|nr:uncharacterized protein AK88_04262 [Plasmodium fragile]KJP86071.1 hypothetical protein AK88_04262 [Plasmodium fragile]
MEGDLARILAQYALDRKLTEHTEDFQSKLWDDMQYQMRLFINQLNDPNAEEHAANCSNAYWQHPLEHGQPGQSPRRMDRSKERVICRLMTQAIYFANGWTEEVKKNIGHDTHSHDIKGLMRCTIADIYKDILTEHGCEGHWGTYYAWYVVDHISEAMKETWGDQHCKKGKYKEIELKTWDMRNKMKTWLKENKQMQEQLAQEQIGDDCKGAKVKLQVGPREEEQEKREDNKTKHEVKQQVRQILGTLQIQMKAEEGKLRGSTARAPKYPSVDAEDDPQDAEIEKHIKEAVQKVEAELNEVIAKTGVARPAATTRSTASPEKKSKDTDTPGGPPAAAAAKPAATKPATTKPVTAAGGGDQQGATPSSPSQEGTSGPATSAVQPQSPPARTVPNTGPEATPGKGASGTSTATGAGSGSVGTGASSPDPTKDATGTGKCSKASQTYTVKNAGDGIHGATSSTAVSFASGAGTDDDCDKKSKDSGPGPDSPPGPGSPDPSVSTAAPAPGPAPPANPAAEQPTTPSKGTETAGTGATTGTSGAGATGDPATAHTSPVAPDTKAPKPDDDDRATTGTHIVSAANGDTNTDPFGSADFCKVDGKKKDDDSEQCHAIIGGGRRAASTRTGAAGAPTGPSAQAERGGAAGVSGTGGLELGIELPEGKSNVGGSYGPGTPQDPHTPHNTPTSPSPDVPDLTGTVLTATTPILVFVTSVILALLGYSLWKYFAHLGKQRRRTYRTVRDVPSPPVDEDILQHLQRGGPPPDYGYTLIRDRQPASTRARRRRHPRVHKRTIIELHLEVLNECEAADWENVKDDYLHILVEEFMGDGNGHSSSLDAPTTNVGLSGHNVPSTDSDATDSCPPNEDDSDPWCCMETIQLQRDRCPPNEEDPDPWSCMETVQLATDPCPPNEDDRWNCMETIQLDTEPHPHSSPRHECATPDHTNWINCIDRNKHLLRACTTQPWFLQLKLEWKQCLRAHMAANEDNGQRAFGEAATLERKKLRLWKPWVARQHKRTDTYSEEEWFQHLLNSVQEENTEETGSQREQTFHVNNIPTAQEGATHAEAEKRAPANIPLTKVKDPEQQHAHHPELRHTENLTAHKLWMLILAFVIEECELERSMQDRELYLDDLLQQL